MSWPGIIRFAADWYTAIGAGLNLAADLLDRGVDCDDTVGAPVSDPHPEACDCIGGGRTCWYCIHGEHAECTADHHGDRTAKCPRQQWDAETGDGLAAAADREARISAVALLAERHTVKPATHAWLAGYDCSCGRSFTDLEVWAEHVAELINDAIDSLIVPAIHPGGDQPASTPHSGAGDSALSSSAVRWPAPDDAGATPSAARGAGHPNTTTT